MCASTVTSAPAPQDGRRPTLSAILWIALSALGCPGPASSCAHLACAPTKGQRASQTPSFTWWLTYSHVTYPAGHILMPWQGAGVLLQSCLGAFKAVSLTSLQAAPVPAAT